MNLTLETVLVSLVSSRSKGVAPGTSFLESKAVIVSSDGLLEILELGYRGSLDSAIGSHRDGGVNILLDRLRLYWLGMVVSLFGLVKLVAGHG